MWKLLIADDEPKIRRGLKNVFKWNELGIEVAGEAENGEAALNMVKDLKPDILLVDICMPFVNGLKFIEQIKDVLPDSIVIVVTGHDEFSYAQQAVKLQVFDYILKPIEREQLLSTINKAKEKLTRIHASNKYLSWAAQQLKKNMPFLRENFLNEWINGHLSNVEAEEQIKFLGLDFDDNMGMIIVKVLDRVKKGEFFEEWDRHVLLFAIQNITEGCLEDCKPSIIFKDDKDNIVAITSIKELPSWLDIGIKIKNTVEENLGQMIVTSEKQIKNGFIHAPQVYEELLAAVREKGDCAPVVLLGKSFIEANYYKEDLSLQDIADNMQISATYLSRLLKRETGLSFIDYLMQIRIKKAIQLINDPRVKIYEVAERVGYKNQHYFSTAFKKILGVSPIEYRKGIKNA